jgi:hypothetical protein
MRKSDKSDLRGSSPRVTSVAVAHTVIAGLDPAIHLLTKKFFFATNACGKLNQASWQTRW